MPTITATATSIGDGYTTGTKDWGVDGTSGNWRNLVSGTQYDKTKLVTQYDKTKLKVSRKVLIPRKPTLDEILFDDDFNNKFDEIEVEVDWPDNIQDWSTDSKWTTTTANNTTG